MSMDNDPTIYPPKRPIEPTEPAYSGKKQEKNTSPYYFNPYTPETPYPSVAPPPPPEQTKKKTGSILLAWIISIVGLILVGLIVFYGITGLPWQSKQPVQVIPPATSIRPTIERHSTAYQIVQKIKGVINIQNISDISNVSGNTGMVQFEVLDANGPVDLTLGTYETKEEAINAMNYYEATSDGPALGYQYSYCMMIYSPGMTTYVLTNIIQQVNEYCA